ncbi:methylated-DNA--[protein]-cysteine S-methyltransferase [Vreelandella titanicae]|uniref:methylated-DNA--[protein]-cysteine S-methyltransferase n=1 Tax=Vreelandella titanicae TaxID=664683 RepID=UPI001F457CD4|nr:methylated-DNA--[protein]-cysteine S-methyltransferase [Halomonas titanicae]MCE7519158.1 methylated-DNA--[protein]-cysteine S-methyltransferase [Halomonas titanicae]
MEKINIQFYKHKHAEFIIGSFDHKLCLLDYRYRKMRSTVDKRIQRGLRAEYVERFDETIEVTRTQLEEYFRGERTLFDIPLLMVGSEFQRKIWDALMKIEYGKTSSYSDLAKSVGEKNAVRAVANANGANSMAIIIPCHRIIGSNGALVGYGGGLPLKRRLLEIEKCEKKQLEML